ncbi:hypothetical protein AMECASPLE_039479, partial [Ameca splendens]
MKGMECRYDTEEYVVQGFSCCVHSCARGLTGATADSFTETCEVWAKPANLDSDYLYSQLQFVYLDYSSQDCGSVPNPPTPALVSTLAGSGPKSWTSILDCLTFKPCGTFPIFPCTVI